jgi:hypothetical protein
MTVAAVEKPASTAGPQSYKLATVGRTSGITTTAWMPATVETSTTVPASAGTPTATEVPETVCTPASYDFLGNLQRCSSEWEIFVKKDTKRVKVAHF